MNIKLTDKENEVLHKYIVSELTWLNYCIEADEEQLANPLASEIGKKAWRRRIAEQRENKRILDSIRRKLEEE